MRHTTPPGTLPPSDRRAGLTLVVLLSAWFLAQFDFFVVNVAAPAFQHELGAGPAALELIVGGYAFSYAAGMITGGRLGDRFGHRRAFVTGVLAFTGASLLCGLATGPAVLVAARLLQGLAAALMVPQVLAMIAAVFPPEARSWALGWYGAAGGIGSIAGQVLGGLLLDADVLGLGWRVIFLVNVPVGLATGVLGARVLPKPRTERASGQDPLGAVAIAGCLGLLLVALSLGRGQGWPAWTWISMAASVPLGAFAAYWQRRLHDRGGAPVLDLTLLRSRRYLAGIGAMTAFMAYFASFMFTLSLLLQGGLGLDPLPAGLVFAPMGVMFCGTALLGARLVERYGPLVTVCGSGITSTGLLLLVVRLSTAGTHLGLGWVVVSLALVGFGNGLVLPRLIGISLVDVTVGRAGTGAAMLTTAQQFAGSAGVAVIGTVFFAAAGPAGDATRGMVRATLVSVGLTVVVALLVRWLTRPARGTRAAVADALRGAARDAAPGGARDAMRGVGEGRRSERASGGRCRP